MNNQIDLRI